MAFRSSWHLDDFIVVNSDGNAIVGHWPDVTPPYHGYAHAPVYLPNNAIITHIDCFVLDSSSTYYVDGYVSLRRKAYSESRYRVLGSVDLDTTAANNSESPLLRRMEVYPREVVDTFSYSYFLSLGLVEVYASRDVTFNGCRIAFQVSTLDP